MTRPLVLIVTMSLDGFIASPDGGVDWLGPMPGEVPRDYTELVDSIDTLVMGRGTFDAVQRLEGGPESIAGYTSYVFTHTQPAGSFAQVDFVSQPAEAFVARLKQTEGGSIWLFGGGVLATALTDAGLVDEYVIAVQPILLGDGIPLWVAPHARTDLELVHARPWPGGIAELRYRSRS